MQQLLRRFFQLESLSGIILFMMAVIAMLWANSPLEHLHQQFIETFLFSINEGLMAIFFLLVGLELKRGFLEGHIGTLSDTLLPVAAALGGMLIPAFIYWAINQPDMVTLKGWATPVATDIAFALGVLTFFGRRVPSPLKMFLLALAIFDDIGAILIIALFYSHELSYLWLLMSVLLAAILYLLNVLSVRALTPYLLIGTCLWFALLHTGIHPTISGVIVALAVPGHANPKRSPLHHLEEILHPWVAYLIMPLFALANAGFAISGLSWHVLRDSVVLGIALGLFLGKQLGVFGFTWLLVKIRWAELPKNSTWLMLYGIALLCGIGFTMSLFLGTLSFQNENALYLTEVRLGVILGSVSSGLVGAVVLMVAFARRAKR